MKLYNSLVAIVAVLAILLFSGGAFSEETQYETLHGDKGDYYRYPPGSFYEREYYRFSIHIPIGVEGCTDDGFPSHHGPSLGPANVTCLDVFKRPAVSLFASWRDPPEDFGGLSGLIRDNCGKHNVIKTTIIIDGQRFFRCEHMDNDLGLLIEYFTYRAPEEFSVTIFCPLTGSCREFEKMWAKIVFGHLRLNWK